MLLSNVSPSTASSLHALDDPTSPAAVGLEDSTLFNAVHTNAYGPFDEVETVTESQYNLHRRSRLEIIQAEHLKAIVPLDFAAAALKLFYAALLARLRVWKANQPLPDITMVMGNLRLGLSSASPIDWDFVEKFCLKMLRATNLGFTGTYDILYAAENGQMVTIKLRVIDYVTGLEVRSESPQHSSKALTLPASSSTFVRGESSPMVALGGFTKTPGQSLEAQELTPTMARRSNKLRSTNPSTISARRDLKKRSPNFSGIKFRALTLIAPATIVAQCLEDFYDLIALKIETGLWANHRPLHFVTFQRWNFQLSFFCYAQAVPWEFIQNFVIDMSEFAQKGFTPTFEARFAAKTAAGQVFVDVALKLLDEAGLGGMRSNGQGGSAR